MSIGTFGYPLSSKHLLCKLREDPILGLRHCGLKRGIGGLCLDTEEFRTYAHVFSDWMADYLASVEKYPVRSQVKPGDIIYQIPVSCPERGEPMETIFADFQETILPAAARGLQADPRPLL